ncbi:MAG: glutamine-hydrolyzing carbamoyl-phosphate synthase small subunit [Clostridia bacterium]|nr:glutamine-hydrolyzing carbamoyl-phosphate synthase small subunit [Clostridia bacterium]
MSKAYLILSDGTVYEGERFGAPAPAVGELVFNTGVVGYIETLTDPSYYGQIVMQTFPQVGNYGIIEEDFEGQCALKGYVVREWCREPSNFRSQYTLDAFLKSQGVPGICGVDTRAVTQHIRDCGVMNAMICDAVPEDLSEIRAYAVTGGVAAVAARQRALYPAKGERKCGVTLVDYGTKRNIIRELQARGCEVTVVPPATPAREILAARPDGVMLSNGPGDPAENTACIDEIRRLLGKVPLFGLCLGHQMMALAAGGATTKLKYGHRGGNQPVIDLETGHTYITSQNHGYAVVSESLPAGRVRFINANDQTCEGVDYPEWNAFSVQFHPEACAGPRDTSVLFDRFVKMMKP